MKKSLLWMLAAILTCSTMETTLTSCSEDSNIEMPETNDNDMITVACNTHNKGKKLTIINFNYPSTDPNGKAVTLSAAIIIGDEVQPYSHEKKAKGFMLYNHFTVYKDSECPTKGDTMIPEMMAGSGLITVAADYYGFGATKNRPQAYCMSRCNAQASVDALLYAKKLLAKRGYTWDDALFNIGYSQGAQTAIGVVRLLTEKYPDIRLTYTIAGGGPYDIGETYRQLLSSDQTDMPSTVISTVLAYNYYRNMGISHEMMFKDPLLSHIDDWVLSKKYTREQIDEKIGTRAINEFLSDELCDLNSPTSNQLMKEFEDDNLCSGWTPRPDEKIYLVHHDKDTTVPVENAKNLEKFLKDNGVNVEALYVNIPLSSKHSAHESAAIPFAMMTLAKVCSELKINSWVDLSKIKF
jgi:hypothetical protein